jgi:hypothetical protein
MTHGDFASNHTIPRAVLKYTHEYSQILTHRSYMHLIIPIESYTTLRNPQMYTDAHSFTFASIHAYLAHSYTQILTYSDI